MKAQKQSVVAKARLKEAPHKLCHLKVNETSLGRDVSFIIPKGMSGRQILNAIKKANPLGRGAGVIFPQSVLLTDDELETVAMADAHIKLTVCFTFNNHSRGEQCKRLVENQLAFAPRWAVTLAAALYRNANGFPSTRHIGTERDRGDLFQGWHVRAAEEGALYTDSHGLDHNGTLEDRRYSSVVAVGWPLSNQSTTTSSRTAGTTDSAS